MTAIRNAFTVWFALVGGIAAWAIHLVGLAALVRYTCTQSGADWSLHGLTAFTLAMAGAATVLSWRLAHGDEDVLRFLGRLGVLINAFNLALIVLEEIYVIALHTRPCG